MKYLIVTADDFGAARSLNQGIIKAYEEGLVTGISILPVGTAFEEAVNWLKSRGLSEVGAHLSLTAFSPLSPPNEVSSLVTRKGNFFERYQLVARSLLGSISLEETYIEWKRQLERIKDTGLRVAYMNSHEHIHMMPNILGVFINLAKEYNIPAVRCLGVNKIVGGLSLDKFYRYVISSYLGTRAKRALKAAGILSPDYLYGFLNARHLTEDILVKILNLLEDGLTEVVCHPGFLSPEILENFKWHINCEDELYAFTSRRARKAIETGGIELTTYQEYLSRYTCP